MEKEAYREDIIALEQQCRDIKSYSIAKPLAGAMLSILGAAILVASGILGAISFGFAAPISMLGAVFGLSMVMGGISVATGCIGTGLLLFSAPLMTNALQNSPLRKSMIELESHAKREYEISTCCIS